MTPTPTAAPSLTDLASAAESALATYTSDTGVIATDQTNIANMQAKIVTDQATAAVSGGTAYSAVGALIATLQATQATLPVPPAPVAPAVPAVTPAAQ